MLWMIGQAEKETRRLHETLLVMALRGTGKDELMLRLDILHSRMALLSEQPQKAYLARIGAAEDLTRDARILAGLSPILENTAGPQDLELPVVAASLTQLADNLGRIANHSMIVDRNEKADHRDRLRKAMYVVKTAFAGLLLAGASLSWMLVSSMRAALRSSQELRHHKSRLEQTVAERTMELRKALETERRAKEVYRSFITTVSHQFRTPLAIIDMVAQRLGRRPADFPPADIAAKARRIRNATQRLTQLVGSVTSAVRLDSRDLPLTRARHDLNDILRTAIAYQMELTPERIIRTDLADGQLACCCDASLIEQVILNLLSNAIKYSPDETAIDMRSWHEHEQVFCSVRDRGIGIPETAQPQIFTRFYRGGNAASFIGSGLGLSLSQTIIELHGGTLSFISEEGKGSAFTFSLPTEQTGSTG
ncbi:sensor histidine kinase [Paracoccus methylarcula]|nr:ATP-binding protein [Paracoccus methylarcula]